MLEFFVELEWDAPDSEIAVPLPERNHFGLVGLVDFAFKDLSLLEFG